MPSRQFGRRLRAKISSAHPLFVFIAQDCAQRGKSPCPNSQKTCLILYSRADEDHRRGSHNPGSDGAQFGRGGLSAEIAPLTLPSSDSQTPIISSGEEACAKASPTETHHSCWSAASSFTDLSIVLFHDVRRAIDIEVRPPRLSMAAQRSSVFRSKEVLRFRIFGIAVKVIMPSAR